MLGLTDTRSLTDVVGQVLKWNDDIDNLRRPLEILKFLQDLGVKLSRSDDTGPIATVGRELFQGVLYNVIYHPTFSWIELSKLRKNQFGEVEVGLLKEVTNEKPWLAGNIECSGMFMPGSLLNLGWWERKSAVKDLPWRDLVDVQSWLYHGFHLWGPSWDVNRWDDASADPFLFGQLGKLDEAESIPVVVADPAKARQCRGILTGLSETEGRLVTKAKVRGRLYSIHELKRFNGAAKSFIDELVRQGAIRENCLIVAGEDDTKKPSRADDIELHHDRACDEPYSGYMWKCVCPREHQGKPDALLYSYFVWEHTNLASKDAINYNIDSMDRKIRYIAEKSGRSRDDFVLLQQMMPEGRLRGDPGGSAYEAPLITVDEFARSFAELARRARTGKEPGLEPAPSGAG